MTAIPVTWGVPADFRIDIMAGSTVLTPKTQMVFTATDPNKADVAATDLNKCRVTPKAAMPDGTPAPVTINCHLPASDQYSAADGAQDLTVNTVQVTLAFAKLA